MMDGEEDGGGKQQVKRRKDEGEEEMRGSRTWEVGWEDGRRSGGPVEDRVTRKTQEGRVMK